MAQMRMVAPASGIPPRLKTMSSLRDPCACAGGAAPGHTFSASVRNAQLDFTRKLLRCSWALVDNVPGFGVEPIAEIVKRYLTAEISPQVVPDFRKHARIHGREKTCSARLAPRTPSPVQRGRILGACQSRHTGRKTRQ